MKAAVSVRGVGKHYRLGLTHARSLNEIAARWTSRMRGAAIEQAGLEAAESARTTGGDFWALKDIDFEVAPGEVVGIIGRNGAGKSTLLKILSRVTRPTTGQIELRGRVGSLLEVGTGFHPELTGRENVYMNGTLLGMSKREVDRSFDEIVDFSGVERFIDTPVKRYSSGMMVRLGFAVAAHLEPEILIVDEVLAVGDAEFQKKCLGKMSDVASHGRTVLFVSHNLGSVERLCKRCLWLANGAAIMDDYRVTEVIRSYLERTNTAAVDYLDCDADGLKGGVSNSHFSLKSFDVGSSETRRNHSVFTKSDAVRVRVGVKVHDNDPSLVFGFALYSARTESPLFWSFNVDADGGAPLSGDLILSAEIPAGLLNDGDYIVEFLAAIHNRGWVVEPYCRQVTSSFSVKGGALGSAMFSGTQRPTLLMPVIPWSLSRPYTNGRANGEF